MHALTKLMKREDTSRMTQQVISTVRALVDAFGGTGRLAEFLHVVPSAVSNALSQNDIPRGWHLEIYLEAERRGFLLDKTALFGLEDDERPAKRKNPKHRASARAA